MDSSTVSPAPCSLLFVLQKKTDESSRPIRVNRAECRSVWRPSDLICEPQDAVNSSWYKILLILLLLFWFLAFSSFLFFLFFIVFYCFCFLCFCFYCFCFLFWVDRKSKLWFIDQLLRFSGRFMTGGCVMSCDSCLFNESSLWLMTCNQITNK